MHDLRMLPRDSRLVQLFFIYTRLKFGKHPLFFTTQIPFIKASPENILHKRKFHRSSDSRLKTKTNNGKRRERNVEAAHNSEHHLHFLSLRNLEHILPHNSRRKT